MPVPLAILMPPDQGGSPTDQYRVEKWREVHTPNPAMLRHLLTLQGYSVFHWTDLPGTYYAMHKHPTEQSHWVVTGSLEITVEGRGTYILEAGDRDFMPAETYHSARVLGDEVLAYFVGEMR